MRRSKYKGFLNIGASVKNNLKFLKKYYHPGILTLRKNWEGIMGRECFKYCKPVKLSGRKNQKNAVLHVVAYNPVPAFYIDNNKLYILDKINTLFGYNAVSDIKIKQEPRSMEKTEKKKVEKKVDEKELKKMTDGIGSEMDEGLREEFKKLARGILVSGSGEL